MTQRKPMQKPTKQQLLARVAHYESSLAAYIESLKENFGSEDEDGDADGIVDADLVVADLETMLSSAPSLEPMVRVSPFPFASQEDLNTYAEYQVAPPVDPEVV